MWLRQIADHTSQSSACLQVSGHTSASGSPALNDRLSVLRAEYVKNRLEQDSPALKGRLVATGVGASEALVGTGVDTAADALDRRVEFKIVPRCV
jgi:outer membrane protein OmpA-like peptidoglycan-associated protein